MGYGRAPYNFYNPRKPSNVLPKALRDDRDRRLLEDFIRGESPGELVEKYDTTRPGLRGIVIRAAKANPDIKLPTQKTLTRRRRKLREERRKAIQQEKEERFKGIPITNVSPEDQALLKEAKREEKARRLRRDLKRMREKPEDREESHERSKKRTPLRKTRPLTSRSGNRRSPKDE